MYFVNEIARKVWRYQEKRVILQEINEYVRTREERYEEDFFVVDNHDDGGADELSGNAGRAL